MPDVEIRPLSDDHLDAAARLLAARHRSQRAYEALLPERFEDPAAARGQIELLWRRPEASGWAALRAGRLVAYLIGIVRERVDEPHVWVDYAGHAAEEAEDIRDVYAAAAAHWVDESRLRHYVQVPAHDRALVDSWACLSFGQQQADGVREVPAHTDVRLPEGVEIRPPTPDDVEAMFEVDLALPQHHRSSPVFSTRPLPTKDESRAEFERTLAAGKETLLVGCRHGRPVACWSLVDAEGYMAPLIAPERACYLGFAATIPEARGTGIGVALTDASFAWAAEKGYAAMGTDWRITNLLASRFWPRRGFRPTFFRLYRHIP
jgi:ribosomal protein S18 acetylase RimI-like enzyme